MPIISKFLGIIIFMHWNDHNPPHFHAKYGRFEAVIGLDGTLLQGILPPRVLSLVMKWLAFHRDELRKNWTRARKHEPLKKIAPLE